MNQILNMTSERDIHQEFIMSAESVTQQINAKKHKNSNDQKLKLDKASATHIGLSTINQNLHYGLICMVVYECLHKLRDLFVGNCTRKNAKNAKNAVIFRLKFELIVSLIRIKKWKIKRTMTVAVINVFVDMPKLQ